MVRKIAEDKKLPILIQRTARRFAGSSDKDWDWILSNNLDRAHGKALQRKEVEHSGNIGLTNGGEMTDEQFAALKAAAAIG